MMQVVTPHTAPGPNMILAALDHIQAAPQVSHHLRPGAAQIMGCARAIGKTTQLSWRRLERGSRLLNISWRSPTCLLMVFEKTGSVLALSGKHQGVVPVSE